MGNTRTTYRNVVHTLGGIALLAGLAACSTGPSEAAGSAGPDPSATSTPTPTATPTPTPTPWDPEAADSWAATTFPITGTDQYVVYTSGQLVEAKAGGSSITSHDTVPGDYELQVACSGGAASSVTIDVTNPGGASTRLTAPCDEEIRTSPYTVVGPEVTVAISGAGEDQVVWTAVLATTPLS
jgi:hypothetical protein